MTADKKHSVTLNGHRTSLSLEDEFWQQLKLIAAKQNTSINALVSRIDETRRNQNLSSALRVYVLKEILDLKTPD